MLMFRPGQVFKLQISTSDPGQRWCRPCVTIFTPQSYESSTTDIWINKIVPVDCTSWKWININQIIRRRGLQCEISSFMRFQIITKEPFKIIINVNKSNVTWMKSGEGTCSRMCHYTCPHSSLLSWTWWPDIVLITVFIIFVTFSTLIVQTVARSYLGN